MPTREPSPQHSRWPELFLVAVFGGILSFQCFVPPFIGLANNGDFSKVCMQFCLGPADGWGSNFHYFVSDYVRSDRYCWYSRMRVTEAGFAAISIGAVRRFGSPDRFDIRWHGAAHLLLFIIAFWLLLRVLRPLGLKGQLAVGLLAVCVFTDVRYASYMNSFYMDASALPALLLAIVCSALALRTRRLLWVLCYAGFTVAYSLSKSPHAASAMLGAALPLALLPHSQPAWKRIALCGLTLLIVVGALASLALTPSAYKGQALYNVVFYRILGDSPDAKGDAEELGVRSEELRYTGTYAYVPESPGRSTRWVQAFYERTGFSRLLAYYLRHPQFVLDDLASDLKWAAPLMRAENVGNLRREDGYGPSAQATRFAVWTDLRSALFRFWPAHIIVWYALLAAGSVFVLRRRPEWATMAWLMVALVIAAATEFGVASLADAVETDRHLYIFHAITDVTVILAVTAVVAIRNVGGITQSREVLVVAENAY